MIGHIVKKDHPDRELHPNSQVKNQKICLESTVMSSEARGVPGARVRLHNQVCQEKDKTEQLANYLFAAR